MTILTLFPFRAALRLAALSVLFAAGGCAATNPQFGGAKETKAIEDAQAVESAQSSASGARRGLEHADDDSFVQCGGVYKKKADLPLWKRSSGNLC